MHQTKSFNTHRNIVTQIKQLQRPTAVLFLAERFLNVLIDPDSKCKLQEQGLTKVVKSFGTLKYATAIELKLEEFNVRNQTALGKFLTFTVLLSSLGGCASSSPYVSGSTKYSPVSTYPNYSTYQLGAIAHNIKNLGHNLSMQLNKEQKRKQTATVYAALEGDYGQVYNWYETTAMGSVKAVHGYPQGSGFCRVIYSTVTKKGKSRNYTETACREHDTNGWRFINK